MIYEMRHYLIERGRMNDNHDRMAHRTPPLLARHGVRVVARWAAVAGVRLPMYCYIMEWKDFAEREAAWAGFYADPEWAQVRAATNAGSELVEESSLFFMRPNPVFVENDADRERGIGGLHQLVIQKTAIGRNPAVAEFLGSTYLPRLKAAGAEVLGVCDIVSGPVMPAVAMLFAWPDETAWRKGWAAFEDDQEMISAYRAQRQAAGTTLLGSADVYLLEPAKYALPLALRTTPR